MKIFLDTAIVPEIKKFIEWGVVYGVTTNPSLIAKSGRPINTVIKEITSLVEGPVSAEVIATEVQGMLTEARELAKIAPNVVIKLPITPDGLQAVKVLSQEGIKTNVTLVFSLPQALLAARAGATYVSPFVGRLDDIGEDGVGLVAHIVDSFASYGLQTQVIAASIRNLRHIELLAQIGVDIATIPPELVEEMIQHQLTDSGIERFLKDYAQSQK